MPKSSKKCCFRHLRSSHYITEQKHHIFFHRLWAKLSKLLLYLRNLQQAYRYFLGKQKTLLIISKSINQDNHHHHHYGPRHQSSIPYPCASLCIPAHPPKPLVSRAVDMFDRTQDKIIWYNAYNEMKNQCNGTPSLPGPRTTYPFAPLCGLLCLWGPERLYEFIAAVSE